MAVRIIRVRKDNGNHDNPHEAISHYEWVNEQTSESKISDRLTMVAWIENNGHAYVRDSYGTVSCYVNTSRAGTKFLQTRADTTPARMTHDYVRNGTTSLFAALD